MKSSRPKRWTYSTEEHPSAPPSQGTNGGSSGVRGLTRADLNVVFQPIVDLETKRIYAYEALTRCKRPEYANPAVLFSHATAEGGCGRLGRIVREVTFERGAGFPLFINVHPDELSARWLVRPDDPLYLHDHHVFIEITESAAFTHYDVCKNVLREMSSRGGVFLAVDDLGAGHSNMKRVIDLEPDVVKLDRALITGLDKSRSQQVLVRHMVEMCRELDATVVAEGIETEDELKASRDVGAQYGQGYLFARPAYPFPKAKWPGAESVPPETAAKTTAKAKTLQGPRARR